MNHVENCVENHVKYFKVCWKPCWKFQGMLKTMSKISKCVENHRDVDHDMTLSINFET